MQGKDSGTVNFDDHDWDLDEGSSRPQPDSTGGWKVAAGIAVGIAIGAALMWALDERGASQPATPPVAATQALRPAAEATVPAPASAKPAQPLRLPAEPTAPAAASGAASASQEAERKAALALREAQRAERKERAWSSFYKKPADCDASPPKADIVECANHFIRARREFEQLYAAGKPVARARATTASCGSPSGTAPTHAHRC